MGKSTESIQSFVEWPCLSHFNRCRIICHLPSPGYFSTRPMGEVRKCLPKIFVASSTVNGPDIRPAKVSSRISLSMISGYSVADGRFRGRKVDVNGGGLPIGEPSWMSCTRLGKEFVKLQMSSTVFQPSTRYRVVCMYKVSPSSGACAAAHRMATVAT